MASGTNAQSELYAVFRGYNERSIRIAPRRLLLRNRQSGSSLEINAKRLADFLVSAEADEALELQRLRDAEAVAHRATVNATTAPASTSDDVAPSVLFDKPEFVGTDFEMLSLYDHQSQIGKRCT